MQIREHGKQLLMIRTNYVPEKKRTVPVTVAKQEKWLSTISDDVRQHLTSEEVEQLENWLSERTKKESVERLESSLSYIDKSILRATEALSVEGLSDCLSKEKADAVYLAMDGLAKALRKAGHKRPSKAPAKDKAQADDRQLALDNE